MDETKMSLLRPALVVKRLAVLRAENGIATAQQRTSLMSALVSANDPKRTLSSLGTV